jgi:putative transcriptional regulator
MKVKELRKLTGLTQNGFSNKYNIPKRTLQDWEAERRTPPEYVIELLERCVKLDTYIKRIDFELCYSDSDDEPVKGTNHEVSVIYNTDIIKEEELEKIINNGMYEYDNRIIVTTPKKANILTLRMK